MKTVTLYNKTFGLYLSAEQIQQAVDEVAAKLNRDYVDKQPLIISILNGSFIFTADLMRRLDFTCYLSFMKLASYRGLESSGQLKMLVGLNENVKGRDVIIVEDIVDSGLTMQHIVEQVNALEPASIRIVTFIHKPEATKVDIKLDYIGIEVPNDFIVGYGLDYDGLGRQYSDIYKLVTD